MPNRSVDHALERLHSARLILQKPGEADIDVLYRIYGDPRTNAFNPVGPLGSLADASALMDQWMTHWRREYFGLWAIGLRDDPSRIIGFGGLSTTQIEGVERVHVGYRFAVEAWGRGLATELTMFSLEAAFRVLQLEAVYAYVRPKHGASRRVLEKAGLVQHGLRDDVPGDEPSILYRAIRPV